MHHKAGPGCGLGSAGVCCSPLGVGSLLPGHLPQGQLCLPEALLRSERGAIPATPLSQLWPCWGGGHAGHVCTSSQGSAPAPRPASGPLPTSAVLWDRPQRQCSLGAQATLQVSPGQPEAGRSSAWMPSLWEYTVSSQAPCAGPPDLLTPTVLRGHTHSGLYLGLHHVSWTSAYGTTLQAPRPELCPGSCWSGQVLRCLYLPTLAGHSSAPGRKHTQSGPRAARQD